ncbi:MAG TPA: hypothetical protein ENG14_06375 [Thermodesulforhabdus norvegica]|uniref:PilZ domain-containing protein n=1 Tax=Thermodesulforhabdus norvegica TaxID=39841 RepID=A0A7C0WV88_9BACT|nr:hypothetical protein [Thermodesulforhabdus norvegica]
MLIKQKPCQVLLYKGEEVYVGISSNFSGEGVLIQMSDPPMLGEKVRLKLQFPDLPNPIELAGEVVWTNPFGMGDVHVQKGCAVKFEGIDPDTRSALDNLAVQYHPSGDPLRFFYT